MILQLADLKKKEVVISVLIPFSNVFSYINYVWGRIEPTPKTVYVISILSQHKAFAVLPHCFISISLL